MKSKLTFPIVCVLALLVIVTTAMALESAPQYGITDEHQWWVQGQEGTSAYTQNWTDAGQDNNMPLVYDINNDSVNEIIQSRSSVVKVYDLNGSVIANRFFAGLGSRQITAGNSSVCPNGKALHILTDNGTMYVSCVIGNNITQGWPCNPPNALSTPDFTGVSLTGAATAGSHDYAIYYYNQTNGSHAVAVCDVYLQSVAAYQLPDYSQTYRGTPPHGNLFNDGWEYFVFPYNNGGNIGITYINRAGSMGTIVPLVSPVAAQDPMDRQPMVIKRGSGQPDELLIPYTILNTGGWGTNTFDRFWYGDATGYTIYDPLMSGEGIYVLNTEFTNAVQLGISGDICFQYWLNVYGGGSVSGFNCFTPSTLLWSYQTSNMYNGAVDKRLTATDMNNDGYSDFFLGTYYAPNGSSGAGLCLYTNNTNNLSCSILGGAADYIYGIDANNDGSRDIIYSDSANNVLKVWLTNSGVIPPPSNASCNDTDYNGSYPTWDALVQGTISGINITNATDSCYNSTMLIEQACFNSNRSASPVYIDCYTNYGGGSCSAGACVWGNVSSCSDTDYNGTYPSVNYFIQGIRSATNLTTEEDYCDDSTHLVEYACFNSTEGYPIGLLQDCSTWGMICNEGACVTPSVQTCTDYDSNSTDPHIISSNVTIRLNGVPYTSVNDSCYNSTMLFEQICLNSTSRSVQAYDCNLMNGSCIDGRCDIGQSEVCAQLGGVYINNQCVFNATTTCFDNDSTTYPTTNYTKKGTMTATGYPAQTDYCYGDFVMEYFCDNTTSADPYTDMFDCTSIGDVCVDGACAGGNVTGNCSDTDLATYPTLNYTQQGTATITIGNTSTSYTDYCSGTTLTEYYCSHPALPLIGNTTYHCYIFGQDCVGGKCVPRVNQTCVDSDASTLNPVVVAGNIQLRVNNATTFQADDSCYNSTIMKEYYCPDNESYSSYAYDCAISGGTCSAGKCVYPNQDNGVSLADMTWCWSDTNGSFDWACCPPQENATHSLWCPVRVTFRYWLGGVANFVLNNFIYFLIIVIIFVIITPYIAPKLRREN